MESRLSPKESFGRAPSRRSLPRLSYLRISQERICLIQHFGSKPDRLIQIPRTAVLEAPSVQGAWVHVVVSHEHGTLHIALRPWERFVRRLVAGPVFRYSPYALGALLAGNAKS